MKPAIQTLTPDQAAEELALLLDEKFLVEDDPIQLHHWKEKNAQRQMDLEMWLMIHPPAVDETPAPGSEVVHSEDAPPQNLQPEVDENPMPTPKVATPEDRLTANRQKFLDLVAQLQVNPGNQPLRNKASIARSNYRNMEKNYKVAPVELPEIPAHPNPRVFAPPAPKAKKEKPAPAPKVEEAHPYEPPTLQDLGITTAARAREVSEALMDAQLAASPSPAFSKDPALGQALHVRAALRGIRRDLLHVIPQIEDLDDQGRNVIEEDLDILDNLVCAALSLAREAGIHQAG